MKRCSKCGETKPLDSFSLDKSSPDGMQYHCKPCNAAYRKRHLEKIAAYQSQYAKDNADAIRDIQRRYRENNADALRESKAAYQRENRDAYLARHKHWRDRNVEKVRSWNRAHVANNPVAAAMRAALRRARKRHATPVWVNLARVREFYESADALGMLTGDWYHVDHIVPLQGRTVCGLHNEFNLQILPAKINQSKSNRHWPDMPL